MKTNLSYWQTTAEPETYSALTRHLHTDVLIIGAGVTGITAAYVLAKQGMNVVLVDKDRVAQGDSARTTAHLTYMTDTRLSDLCSKVGEESAMASWYAGRDAMLWMQKVVVEEQIECEFQTIPGYLAAQEKASPAELEQLRSEGELALEHGLHVAWQDRIPPTRKAGLFFADQMMFHPLKYLKALAARVHEMGGLIFENTPLTSLDEQERLAAFGEYQIHYKKLILATHVPVQGGMEGLKGMIMQTKLYAYSTYAIAAKVPLGTMPPMIWSNTANPFLYLRVEDAGDHQRIILGGEDHKTGAVEDTETCYRRLEDKLRKWFPSAHLMNRWSGQVIETPDGLPYMGELAEDHYLATGYSGNGYTFGTYAALMIRDLIEQQESRWGQVFDPRRKSLLSAMNYVSENSDFPRYYIKDRIRLKPTDQHRLDQLKAGEGITVQMEGKPVAVSRDDTGELMMVSAVCPHMGCIVHWNGAEGTWDCPCHGSRFQADGHVIAGPAMDDLLPCGVASGKSSAKSKT